MDNTQTEAMTQNDGLVDGGADIVAEVREETDTNFEEQVTAEPQEEVSYDAPEQVVESETTPYDEWEVEAKKFQSMYDKSQSELERLRRL